jgi:hypothetical protein
MPLTFVAHVAPVLVVHPSNPATSVQDLIARAKAAKKQLTFGSSGTGVSNHIAGELLRLESRVPNMMKHVCVAARIGDSKAPGEGNSRSIAKTSNADSADSGCNPSGWHEFWPMALSKGPLLRVTKPRDFLLALSQNRDSASRVSSC